MADAEMQEAPTSAPEGQEAPAPEEAPAEPAPPVIVTPEAVKRAEQAALNVQTKINMQAQPVRAYLESTLVPTLMAGMAAVVKERPENPVEYMAYYLLTHNPEKSKNPVPAAAKEMMEKDPLAAAPTAK